MARNNKTGNGPAKAFGGVVALVAIVLGVYAMVEPMNQRIDYVKEQLKHMRDDLRRHGDLPQHVGAARELSAIQVQFTEVETQFDCLELRINEYEQWRAWWNQTVPAMDATQNEKIRQLEKRVDEWGSS